MQRWDCRTNDHTESAKIDKFLDALVSVCVEHGFSISHEDEHGAFMVVPVDVNYLDWLKNAHIDKTVGSLDRE